MEPGNSTRRKLRKGTRSCWNCKRRKVRCSFVSSDDLVCINCRKRGTTCVGQEYDEQDLEPQHRGDGTGVDSRIIRIEAQINELIRKTESFGDTAHGNLRQDSLGLLSSPQTSHGYLEQSQPPPTVLTSSSTSTPGVSEQPITELRLPNYDNTIAASPHISTSHYSLGETSRTLHSTLPSNADVQLICDFVAAADVLIPLLLSGPAPDQLGWSGDKRYEIGSKPARSTHPTLLARWMLKLAVLLHYVQPSCQGLSESPETILSRLVDTANSLVTSKDDLISTAEGIEALMLEGIFHCNVGNLQRSCICVRRSMTIAQLLGLHRPNLSPVKSLDPGTVVDQFWLWNRIVFVDRHLSLMLGIPQGFAGELAVPIRALQWVRGPVAELERIQNTVASRIIHRNEHRLPNDVALTLEIDQQLQDASNKLPEKWWLPPGIQYEPIDKTDSVEIEARLTRQLFHYNLVNQLHLPYLLDHSSPSIGYSHTYSRYSCINASREIIRRFLSLPSVRHIVFCFRALEFFVQMAGITLLLAHLDSHRRPHEYTVGGNDGSSANLLTHHRLSDRAMVEVALDRIKPQSRLSDEQLSRDGTRFLQVLFRVESAAAEGHWLPSDVASAPEDLAITIPFLGEVSVSPEGLSIHPASGKPYTVNSRDTAGLETSQASTLASAQNLPRREMMSMGSVPSFPYSTMDAAIMSSSSGIHTTTAMTVDVMPFDRSSQYTTTQLADPSQYSNLGSNPEHWTAPNVYTSSYNNLLKWANLTSVPGVVSEDRSQLSRSTLRSLTNDSNSRT